VLVFCNDIVSPSFNACRGSLQRTIIISITANQEKKEDVRANKLHSAQELKIEERKKTINKKALKVSSSTRAPPTSLSPATTSARSL